MPRPTLGSGLPSLVVRTLTAITAALSLAVPSVLLATVAQPPPPAGGGTTTTEPVATPATTTPALTSITPVLGKSRLTPEQIASWFARQGVTPTIVTPILDLARIFVDEGNAQNVRGDIAFAQSVLETGWFAYSGSMVKATDNNYSGLGACDTCSRGAIFPTPADGVRAQIQHLWVYADPTASIDTLARPQVDPRFLKVSPPGKSPTWEQMGNGNWATSPDYAVNVLLLYNRMLKSAGLSPTSDPPPFGATPRGPQTILISRSGAVRLGSLRARSGTLAGAASAFGPPSAKRAGAAACRVTWSPLGATVGFQAGVSGDSCADDAKPRAAVLSSPVWKTSAGLAVGESIRRMKHLYGRKTRVHRSTAVLIATRSGVRLAAKVGEGVVKSFVVSLPAPKA